MSVVVEEFHDPLTSLKLFTEGEIFDRNIWWKIEYNLDNRGNITSEKSRHLFLGKPPLYVPSFISYMPAVKKDNI